MLDAKTYTNADLISLAKESFINVKIDAESEIGQKLFSQFQGAGLPLIIFLDNAGNEIDRFYGYKPAYEFSIKMENILSGKNTFTYFLSEFEQGNYSAEILKPLADKYREKGDNETALSLYLQLLGTGNIAKDDFIESRYYIASLSLKKDNLKLINEFLINFENSDFFEVAVYDLISYYKGNNDSDNEVVIYNQYIEKLINSSQFLNGYAWRMSELNINLDDALVKVNHALTLLSSSEVSYANILDTKAEVLWKAGHIEDAISIIEEAISLNPESQYYKAQKEKFVSSSN